MSTISKKAQSAFKWSSISEILSKMITPLINMLLARILAPEIFGVVATVTMVISFAEVFVDSGFNRVLIQRSFDSTETEHVYLSTSFWANLILSVTIWGLIICFNIPIAKLVNSDGYGNLLIVAGCMIPLYGIVGIQDVRIKKKLEFKKLFIVRLTAALVPLFITTPLALLGFEYWSLIIGNIVSVLVRLLMMFLTDRFIPSMCFRLSVLKEVFKSASWTMLDGLAVWATSWVDVFLISKYMNDYHLGLYKNTTSTITSLLGLVTSAITPVMLSALSKLKDNESEFNSFLLSVQKVLTCFILPMGVGALFYRELVTDVLFGDKWSEAAEILGVFALTSALRIIFISIYSDAYRAKGKFFLPLILQLIDLSMLIPVCVFSAKYGFWCLVYSRSLIKLDLIIPEMICIWIVCGISVRNTLKNILHPIIATIAMSGVIIVLQLLGQSVIWSILSIALACVVYFAVLYIFKNERDFIKGLIFSIIRPFRKYIIQSGGDNDANIQE